MDNLGVSGYASMLKSRRNLHERDMETTAGVIQSMPAKGPAAWSRVPLMYALGQSQARANEFDAAQARETDTYLGSIQKMQQEKFDQEKRGKSIEQYFKLAQLDPDAANKLIESDPILRTSPLKDIRLTQKAEKGWITGDYLSPGGAQKNHFQVYVPTWAEAGKQLKAQGIDPSTPGFFQKQLDVAAKLNPGSVVKYSGATKEQTDKPQSQVVRDKTSETGWSYLTEQGNLMQGAPDPTKARERISINTGNPDKDRKYETTLRKEFEGAPIVKSFDTIRQQAAKMESAVGQLQNPTTRTKENYIALDQSLIMVFNKMLDPESVVREGEYARTIQNSPMLSRIIGKMDQIRAGGAGFTNDERKAIITMGREFYRDAKGLYDGHAREYERIASETGAEPTRVVIKRGSTPKSSQGVTAPKSAAEYLNKFK